MNALQAFSMLRRLDVPVVTTADASAVWREAASFADEIDGNAEISRAVRAD